MLYVGVATPFILISLFFNFIGFSKDPQNIHNTKVLTVTWPFSSYAICFRTETLKYLQMLSSVIHYTTQNIFFAWHGWTIADSSLAHSMHAVDHEIILDGLDEIATIFLHINATLEDPVTY